MNNDQIISWLLNGDVSIQYQANKDLLKEDRKDLQKRISEEGWGKEFLSKRNSDGQWGQKFYQPKWTSSHYTLLDLRNLCIVPTHQLIKESLDKIVNECKVQDGGIGPAPPDGKSDVCVNGMFLNYASYFNTDEGDLASVVDFLLSQHMKDGGFNCRSNRSLAVHSSFHSTVSVLEGITEYEKNGYQYRVIELAWARKQAIEFILKHRLFLSDHTGDIIHKDFLKLSYPSRWRYDILRALDYFQYAKVPWDNRMKKALEVLARKRNKDGTWNVQAKHPGQVHFDMEKAGKPSKWNTLRALRVLKHYNLLDQ
ncbi:MAG: hypothetical protein ABJG47_17255 [Ekhidna sp.]